MRASISLLKYIHCSFTCLVTFCCFGQNGINQLGAKAAGMGYAYAIANDPWALFNNPGGIGKLEGTTAVAGFESRFDVVGLHAMGAGILTNISLGTIGLTAFKFGDDLYSEQIASLNFANSFGIASLGARVNYLQYAVEGLGTQAAVTVDVGGTAQLTDIILVGAYVRNINQAKVSEINDQRVPTILYAGIGIRPNDKVLFSLETEKDIAQDAMVKAGLAYQFLEKFTARTGVRTNRFANFFGLSFSTQKLDIDYALTWDNILGLNHQVAISYTIK